jgi:hypothetical protein
MAVGYRLGQEIFHGLEGIYPQEYCRGPDYLDKGRSSCKDQNVVRMQWCSAHARSNESDITRVKMQPSEQDQSRDDEEHCIETPAVG